MALARDKSRVDAAFYAAERTAQGNRVRPARGGPPTPGLTAPWQLLFTKEYLELARLQALTNKTKIYFGPSVPAYFGALGLDAAAAPAE